MTEVYKEYAEALFKIALEQKKQDEFCEQLHKVKEVIDENPQYIEFLASPAIPLSERLHCLREAFSALLCDEILATLEILCKNGRIKGLYGVIDAFFELKKINESKVTANVYYVFPLSNEQKSALLERLEAKTGKKVEMVFIEDKSLLGGIKIEIDDVVFDGSASRQLKDIKGVINK